MAIFNVREGTTPIVPHSKHAETPAWPAQLCEFVYPVEEEVDRGDMREGVEIGGVSWNVVQKLEFIAAEAEFRGQRCPGGNGKAM